LSPSPEDSRLSARAWNALSSIAAGASPNSLARGEFEFACLIPGHYQAGMTGKIVVKKTSRQRTAALIVVPLRERVTPRFNRTDWVSGLAHKLVPLTQRSLAKRSQALSRKGEDAAISARAPPVDPSAPFMA
jgi:hypothetical protein